MPSRLASGSPLVPSMASWRRLVALGAVAALFLAGCSGSAPDDEEADPAANGETGAPADPEDGSGNGEQLDLEDALERLPSQAGPAQVVYELDDPNLPGEVRMTIAQDPPEQAQLFESDDGRFLTIIGDPAVFCTDDGTGWQCLPGDLAGEMGVDPDAVLPDTYEPDDFEESELDPDTEAYTDTIIGRAAICLLVPQADDGATEFEVCFDEETAVMLHVTDVQQPDAYTLEAVEFSDPDPELFVPPAEPMDIPG